MARREATRRKSTNLRRGETLAEVDAATRDPLVWLQQYTRTQDKHWKEAGAAGPYRPFPDKPYFRPMVDAFLREPIMLVEKSRDMMASWLFVGLFTHWAMTMPGIEILCQSQKESKAGELIEYARVLWEQQSVYLREAYPLAKPLSQQSGMKLEFANGSRMIGIPHGADQIRSYHPTGLLGDEVAFQPDAGESYDHAVPVCQKIVFISSAGPGWFAEFLSDSQ